MLFRIIFIFIFTLLLGFDLSFAFLFTFEAFFLLLLNGRLKKRAVQIFAVVPVDFCSGGAIVQRFCYRPLY